MTWEERGKKIYESSSWGKKGKDIRDRLEERTKRTNELINKHNEIVTSRINGPGPLGVSSLSSFVNAQEAKNGGDTEKARYAKRNAFQTALDYGERAAEIDNLADEYYNKYTISNPGIRNNVQRYINAAKGAKETADLYSNYLANTYGTRENAAAIEKNEELDKDIFYKKQKVNRYESGMGRVPTKYKDRVQKTIDSLNEEIAELEAQKTNVPTSAETGDKYLAALEEQFAFDKDLDVRDVLSSVDKINALLEKTSDPETRDYLIQRRAMVMSTEQGVDMTKNYDEDIRVIEEAIKDKENQIINTGVYSLSEYAVDDELVSQLRNEKAILENQKARLEQFKSIYDEYRHEHRIRDLLEKGGFSEEEYQTIANLPYIEKPTTGAMPRISSPSAIDAAGEAGKNYRSQMSEIEGIYKNSGLTDGEIRELKEYFQDLKSDAEYDEVVERAYRMANDSVVGAVVGSIASVPAGLIGGIQSALDSVGQWFANLFRDDVSKKPITYKNAANHLGAFSDTVRQTIQENVDWNVGDFDAFDFLYGNLMSTADSALAAGASFVIPGSGQVLLGASAARSTTKDLIDRGVTGGQAVLGGIVAGVFEALFENITIGNIKALQAVKPVTWKDSVKNILKSVGVNASEEAATEVSNIIYDTVANGSFSDFELRKQDYINQGMSEEEASNKVALELFGQVLESGASGALMGLTFGSAGSVSASFNMSSIGGRVNGETVRLAKDLASTLDPSSKAFRLGQELSESSGDMFKGSAVSEIVNEVYGNQTMKIVADKIEDIGYDGDSESLAREMLETASSKKLSSSLSRKLDKVSNKNDMYQLWVSLTPESENPSLYETEAREKYGVANGVNKLTANIIMEEITASKRTPNTNEATAEGLSSDNSPNDGGNISFEADNIDNESGYGFYGEQYGEQYDKRYGGETVGEIYNPRSGRVNSDIVSPKVKLKADIQTVKSDTGETVAIERYKGLKDGKIIFQTNSGEADIDSVSLPASLRSAIEYAVQNYDGNTVNTFLKFINGNETAFEAGLYSAYAEAFAAFYNFGRINYETLSFENAASLSPASLKFLGHDAALAAYNMGKRVAENERDSVGENKKTPRRTVKRKGEGKYVNKASDSALDEVYLQLSKKLGINIERVQNAGKNVRGQFIPNIMTIVLSEQDSNEYQTMGHELAEFAAEFNPERMNKLYGALMRYALYSAENESDRRAILRLVRQYESGYSAAVKKTSYKEASEEYLNNVLGRLLASPSNAERFSAWLFEESGNTVEENRSILQTLVDLINRIIDKINEFLKGSEFRGIGDTFKNAETRQAKAAVDKFLEILDEAAENAGNASVAEDADNNIRYRLNEGLGEQLNDWLKGNGKKHGSYNGVFFELGTTPDIFVKHGAPSVELIMYSGVLEKITGGKHSISLDEIAKLPSQLNDPVLLFKGSVPQSFVALTELVDNNGNEVIAAVHINKRNGRNIVNRIASVYSKTDEYGRNRIISYINNQINQGNLLDASKEKAPIWFTSRGLQLPKLVQTIIDASIDTTISQNDKNVNTNYTRDSEKYSSGENEGNDVRRYGLDFDDGTDIKYSIEFTNDNRPVVVIENDILKDVPRSEWVKTVKNTISEKFSGGIPVSGRLIKVNKITRNEYTNSQYTKTIMRSDDAAYADKFRSANNLDEIVLASTNYINEDLKHERSDTFKEFARGDVLINVGEKKYSARVIVGLTGNNSMVLYDIVSFKPASFEIRKRTLNPVMSQKQRARRQESSSVDTTISQNDKNVNTNYTRDSEKYSLDIDSGNIDKNRQSSNDIINGIGSLNNTDETKGADINGRYNNSGRNSSGQEQSGFQSSRTYSEICQTEYFRGRDNQDLREDREKISIKRVGNRLEITDIEDKDTFSFTEVSEKDYTRDAKTAVRLFNAANIPVYVFELDSMRVFENGKEQDYLFNGVSVGGGQAVLINNHLVKISGRGIFSHEMLHVGIVSPTENIREAFAKFNDTVLQNSIVDNIIYRKEIDRLIEFYGKGDLSLLSEEYVALISEIIGTDSDWSYYSQMFKNPEAVRRAWAEAFKNYMPEARYSLDIDDSLSEEDARFLIRENEELSELNRYLKEELRLSRGKLTDANEVRSIAATIREEYGSALTVEEIFSALKAFYDSVGEGVFTGDYIDIVSRDIAARILENSKYNREVSEENRAILKEIREYPITFNEEQKREAAYLYGGSFNEYRTRNFGRLRLVNESEVSLDAFWQEMSDKYPWLFDADVSPAEMPARLLEVVGALSETYDDPNGLTFEDASYLLATEIKEKYVDSRRSTFADRKKAEREKAVAREKKRGREKLAEAKKALREEYNGRLREVREKNAEKTRNLRADTKNKLERQQAKYRDMIVRKSLRQKETAEKNKFLRRIRRNVKTLNSLLVNETDARHIPEDLKKAVAGFLKCFAEDSGVFTKERLLSLKDVYSRIEEASGDDPLFKYNAFIDSDIRNDITELTGLVNGRRLSQLSSAELREVTDIVGNVSAMINYSNAIFYNEKKEALDNTVYRARNVINEERKRGDKVKRVFQNSLAVKEFTPVYLFKRLGGVFEELHNDILDGVDKYMVISDNAKSFYYETEEKYNFLKWDKRNKELVKITTESGETLSFTGEQALSLYATAKRERLNYDGKNADHIGGEGIVLKDKKYKNTYHGTPLTANEVNEVIAALPGNARAFADEIVSYMSEELANEGNEASTRLFGIEKFKEPYYFPYTTADFWKPMKISGNVDSERIKHLSFTRRTTSNARSAIVIGDFTDVFFSHAEGMAKYSALALPQENLLRVMNYKSGGNSVKNEIAEVYGESVVRYIEKYLADISGATVSDDMNKILNRALSYSKKASIAFNNSVAIQQISSVVRAMNIISPRYFDIGGIPFSQAGREYRRRFSQNYEEMKKYCPIVKIKEIGGVDTGTGTSMLNWMKDGIKDGGIKDVYNAVDDAGSRLPNFADKLAWSIIWNAVKSETKAKNPAYNGEVLFQAAAKRFREVIYLTQVVDVVTAKSEYMRNKSFGWKVLTSYMSEPTLTFNMLLDSATNSGNRAAPFRRSLATWTFQTILNALLKSIILTLRDDDEDKTYLEKYLGTFTEETIGDLVLLNMIPVGRDVWSILEGYTLKRNEMAYIDTAIATIEETVKLFNGSETADIFGIINSTLTMAGIPVLNSMREIAPLVTSMVKGWGGEEKDVGKQIKYSITDALSFTQYLKWNNKNYEGLANKIAKGDEKAFNEMYDDIVDYLVFYGKSEKEAKTTVRSQLTRIFKKKYKAGTASERDSIRKSLIKTGIYTDSDIDLWDKETAEEE